MKPQAHNSTTARWRFFASLRWCPWLATVLVVGCTVRPPIDSEYGRCEGGRYGESVNGTFVLSDMFAQAGFEVSTTRFLGRLVSRADVVVWFPDDYALPDDQVRHFFRDWLIEKPNRTLIYVAREFDAEATYWNELEDRSEPATAIEYRRLEALARSSHDDAISALPEADECPWFKIDRAIIPRRATEFTGPWSDGLVAAETDIRINSRLIVPENSDDETPLWQSESLLRSGDDVIVAEISRTLWNNGRIIVVNNGSWLLNMPLINRQHRQLAGRLVRRCRPGGKAVFVESGVGGPAVAANRPLRHHGLEAFAAWPINVVLIHLTVLGMFYCFSVFPIFGRAKRSPSRDNSDFGRHITALGELLARTHDDNFAREQIAHCQQLIGETHLGTTTVGNPRIQSSPRERPRTAAARTTIATTVAAIETSHPPNTPPAAQKAPHD